MRILTLLFALLMTLFSCTDSDDKMEEVCGVDNPIENLEWLKSIVEEADSNYSEFSKYFYITQATYKDKTVFVSQNCCPNCNSVFSVYNCQGQVIGYIGDIIKKEEITNFKIIYKPENFACDEN